MAQVFDTVGRVAQDAQMDLKQLRELIRSLSSAKDMKPMSKEQAAEKGIKLPEPKTVNNKAIDEIKKLLTDYTKNYKKDSDDSEKYLEEMKDHLANLEKAREEKKESKTPTAKKPGKPVVSKSEQVMSKQIDNLTRHATKKGSLYTHDIYMDARLQDVIQAIKDAGYNVNKTVLDAGGRKDVVGIETNATLDQINASLKVGGIKAHAMDPAKGKLDPVESKAMLAKQHMPKQSDQLTDLYKVDAILQKIQGHIRTIEDAFFGVNIGQEIFKGIVKEESKFIQDTRAVAYEIGGVTKEMRGMQRQFENIGKTAAETGFDRSMFQKDFLKNLKRGITDLKTANKITTASLNTEKMLGLEAGELQDTFANWHQQLRMNDGQVAEMGRGLRDVARYTGLTGQNLTKAVSSSEEFLKTMRNSATLTATAAKNIIEISASAQKLGVGDTMNPLMKAMTNTNNLIREASQQTRALLINAAVKTGRLQELMNGVVLKSKAGIKDMAKGLEKNLQMFGVKGIEEIDNLTEDAKMRLNLQLKAAFGIELGEMRQTIEALKEAGKTFGDRLEDINKKRKANLTLEEKAALAEEERKLKASKSMEVLTALDEAAKGAQNMDQALAKFGTRRKEFEDDLNAMGIAATDNADVARQALKSAVANVNEGLKKSGKQELKIDSSAIEKALQDPVAFRELQATITKAEQQAAVAQKAQLDPVTEIKQKVIEMNDTLRNMSQGILSALMNSIFGKLALIATAVASVGTFLAMQGTQLKLSSVYLGDLLKSVNTKHGGWGDMLKSAFGFGGGTPPAGGAPGMTAPPVPTTPAPPKTPTTPATAPVVPPVAPTTPAPTTAALPAAAPTAAAPATGTTAATAPATKPTGPADYTSVLNEMLAALRRIADCICKPEPAPAAPPTTAAPIEKAEAAAGKEVKKGKMTPEQIATAKAEGQARKQKQLQSGMDPAVAKSIQRKQLQNIKQDDKLAPAAKKEMVRDIRMGKKSEWMQKREFQFQKKQVVQNRQEDKLLSTRKTLADQQKADAKSGGPASAPPTPPTEGWNLESLTKSGPEMAKTAAAIMVMAVGVVALGAAIVFLSHKVISAFKLDISKVMETAAVVGAVAVAGGAIVAASVAAINALEAEDTRSFIGNVKKNWSQLMRTAAAIVLIGPAIVLLGAAIVGISQKILSKFKLNLSTTLETAAVVAAVGAAAAAILKGASEALEAMETMDKLPGAKKLMANPGKMAWTMAKGALALIILGPAVVLLGATIVKLSQLILGAFGLDAQTAIKTGYTIAAVMISAAIIAGAVIGAMFGLFKLGVLAAGIKATGPMIALGALALVVLTPLVVMLALAIVKMASALLGAFGISAKMAAETALNVAGIMVAAAVIAGACIAAMYGLFQLGLLAATLAATYKMILLGAGALLLLSPLVIMLAAAVVKIADSVMDSFGIDAKKAVDTAKNVAGIMVAAAVIAGACIAAMYGLFQLGVLAMVLKTTYKMILLGAGALLLLTPAMLILAQAILYMAQNLVQMDPKTVEEIVKKVMTLMKGAAEISMAVLLSAGALALLGLAMTTGTFWIAAALAVAGAAALLLLTPAMIQLAHAILMMGQQLTEMISLEDAKKIADGVKSIFESAGVVSDTVLGQAGNLVKIGLMSMLGVWIVGLMKAGANFFFTMAKPVGQFVMSILAMGKEMTNAMSMDEAKAISTGIKTIFDAAGVVAEQFSNVASSLIKMGFVSLINIGGWIVGMMEAGAKFFFQMAKPIGGFVMSLLAMGQAMKNEMPPQKTREIVEGVKGVFEAAGAVNDALTSQMGTLMKLGMLSWFKWLIPDLDKATEFFMSMARPAMKFTLILVAMGRILVASAGGPKKIKPLIEAIKGIAEIVEAVGKIMDVLMKSVVPMTRKKWFGLFGSTKLDQIADAAPQFEKSFESITSFIRFGIIRPIQRTFKCTGEVTKTISVAKGLADIITAAGVIMETVSKVVLPMTRPGWFGIFGSNQLEKLAGAVPQFETAFQDIVHFVKNAIINPLRRSFKDCSKVKSVIGIAKLIADAMSAIVPMMATISKVVVGMTTAPSFLWFTTGSSTIDKLKEGIEKIDGVFAEIVGFVKNGLIGPIQRAFPNLKKVQGVIQVAKAIGESVAQIAIVMDILANKLAPMADAEQASWWQFWKSDKPNKITQIETMIDKFQGPFRGMVNFLKNGLIGPVTQAFPNLKAVEGILPIVKGVGEAISAIVGVLDALANKLAPLAEAESAPWYKFWKGDGPSKFERLEQLKPTIEQMWNSLVYFVRDGLIYPVMRAFPDLKAVEGNLKTVRMVADAVKAVAEVMETMQEIATTINPLSGLQALFGQMDKTVSPLERQIPMIQSMFLATTKFIQEGIIAPVSALNPTGLQGAVQRLKLMQTAMTVMNEMIESLEGMVGMTKGKPSVTTGMWWWKKTTEAVAPMTDQMAIAIPEIQGLFTKIVDFVQKGIVEPVSKLDGITLKRTVKTLIAAAKAISMVPSVIENLDEVMSMLSPGDYFNPKFPMDRIMMARKWFEDWFPKIAGLIQKAIIEPVESNFKDATAVKKAAKIIMAVAKLLEKLPEVIENLDNAMSLMSPGDKMNLQFPMDRIIAQEKWWREWFPKIGSLIKDTIVANVETSFGGDVKKVKNAAKILNAVAMMIEALPKVIENLDRAMSMMSPGEYFDFNFPMDRIIKAQGWYEAWFPRIAMFIRKSIMDVVEKQFTDVKNVKNAAAIMKAVACMISALPAVIKNLDEAMSMMSPGEYFNLNFPMDRIIKAMPWYKTWFESIAKFVKTAIVDVVTTQFNDIKALVSAARAMKAVACIITAIPAVMKGLDAAMALMSPGDYFDLSFPMDRIIKGIPWFSKWFESIAKFINGAIVGPVNSIFGNGKDLMTAARLMRAMSVIIAAVPKIIMGLSNTMKLMGEGGEKAFDDDFPMDRIMMYKDKFGTWFKSIAAFLRDGIVEPILSELDKKVGGIKQLVMAARVMRAMAVIITTIPKVIMGVANGLIPLVDNGMDLRDTPAEKIEASKDEFADWFKKVAIFMRDGIVMPIIQQLPDVKTIVMAARILRAMSTIVMSIPIIIRNLSKVFGPLTPDSCLADSPIAILAANTHIFEEWFRQVAAFLRQAVIKPILDYFPQAEEVKIVRQALIGMINVTRMLPVFLRELAATLAPMFDKKWMAASPIQMIGTMVVTFADWFFAVADALISGVIAPVVNYFPDDSEIEEVMERMGGMTTVLRSMPQFLTDMNDAMADIYASNAWGFGKSLKVDYFSYYFKSFADALSQGIIVPVMSYLPEASELKAVTETMTAMTEMVGAITTAVRALSDAIKELNEVEIGNVEEANLLAISQAMSGIGSIATNIPSMPSPPVTPQPGEGEMFTSTTVDDMTPPAAPPKTGMERFKEMLQKAARRKAAEEVGTANEITSKGGPVVDEDPSAQVIDRKIKQKEAVAQKKTSSSIEELALNANKQSGLFVSDLATQKILQEAVKWLSGGKSAEVAAGAGAAALPSGEEGTEFSSPVGRLGEVIQKNMENGGGQQAAKPVAPTTGWRSEEDTQRRVQQERVGTQTSAMTSMPELGKIAASTAQEAQNSSRVVELLETLVKYMQPSSVGGNSNANVGDTQTKYTVTSPPRYYKWNTGKHNQVAGKAVSNIGSTSY